MPRLFQFMLFVALINSTSGCFPYHYTTRPGISGTIIAGDTFKPLAGAQIFFGPTNVAAAVSADDGKFTIKPKKFWWIYIIQQDVFWRRCALYIQDEGYQTNLISVPFNPAALGPAAKKDLGVIVLKPAAN